MIGGSAPVAFHAVVAAVAISGALLLADQDAPGAERVLTFADREIDESSGLVDQGELVLTVNDSGSGPVVYAVDRESGQTVGRTTYTGDEVVDVEALAAGPDGSVWVGDIGDNGGRRLSVSVYRVPEVTEGDRSVEAPRYDFRYPGGPRDAEALLVDPRDGRLYVVSKGLLGGEVFAAPERLEAGRVHQLRRVGSISGMVTDGAFLPDGRHAVLRTYSSAGVVETGSWRSAARMPLPDQRQGEGLAVTDDARRLLLSTEGAGSDVVSVPLTAEVLAATAASAEGPSAAAPSGDAAAEAPVVDADGWSGRTWTAVGLLGFAGVVAVGSAVRGRRRRRPLGRDGQSRSTT